MPFGVSYLEAYKVLCASDQPPPPPGSTTFLPRVQTWSRLPGTVWRGLIFFMTDRPHYHRMPPLSGDNHGWVVSAVRTGCALGHRATTIRTCTHLMKTAARYQLRAQGRSFVPGPNKFGGITGRSPGERPHYGIVGESPACRGKSRQTGPDVNAGYMDPPQCKKKKSFKNLL